MSDQDIKMIFQIFWVSVLFAFLIWMFIDGIKEHRDLMKRNEEFDQLMRDHEEYQLTRDYKKFMEDRRKSR